MSGAWLASQTNHWHDSCTPFPTGRLGLSLTALPFRFQADIRERLLNRAPTAECMHNENEARHEASQRHILHKADVWPFPENLSSVCRRRLQSSGKFKSLRTVELKKQALADISNNPATKTPKPTPRAETVPPARAVATHAPAPARPDQVRQRSKTPTPTPRAEAVPHARAVATRARTPERGVLRTPPSLDAVRVLNRHVLDKNRAAFEDEPGNLVGDRMGVIATSTGKRIGAPCADPTRLVSCPNTRSRYLAKSAFECVPVKLHNGVVRPAETDSVPKQSQARPPPPPPSAQLWQATRPRRYTPVHPHSRV